MFTVDEKGARDEPLKSSLKHTCLHSQHRNTSLPIQHDDLVPGIEFYLDLDTDFDLNTDFDIEIGLDLDIAIDFDTDVDF